MASTYHADIQALYVAYFNRPADYLGLDFWETAIENAVAAAGTDAAKQAAAKAQVLAQISAGFAASDEYMDVYGGLATEQVIGAVYQNLFGHAPDLAGLKFWVDAVRGGHMTVANAVTTIAAGAQGTDKETFENKVAASVAFTNEFDTGEEVLAYNGEEALTAAKLFIGSITTDESLAAAIAPAAIKATVAGVVDAGTPDPVVVQHALTTGIDTINGTAGNDVISGVISGTAEVNTFTNLDTINGGTGTDVLEINMLDVGGGTASSNVSVSNVEVANVRSAGQATVDSTTWTGLQTLNITQSAAATVTAGSSTSVNVAGATGTVKVDGGANVAVTASGAGQAVTIGADVRAAGSVSVTHTNLGAGAVAVDGGTNVTITATKVGTGTVSVGQGGVAADLPTGAIVIKSTGAASAANTDVTLGAIKVDGGSTVVVEQTATSSAAKALTDTDGATITQSAVTVDGGANTTSVTVTQSAAADEWAAVEAEEAVVETNLVTFAALAKDASVTVGGLTFTAAKALTAAQVAAAFANLSAGAVQGSAPASNGVYSGTLSTDFVSGAATSVSSTAATVTVSAALGGAVATDLSALVNAGVVISNVVQGTDAIDAEDGELGVVGGMVTINGAITGTDKIATVSLTGFGAGSTIASDALTTLNLASSNADVAVTNAVATTLTLNLNGVGTSLDNALVDDVNGTYTTLNINATGASSNLDIDAVGVTALTVAGDKSVVLNGSTLTALKTVTVTGAAGVSGDFSGANVTAVNTAATSGNNTVTIDGTKATFTGGAGKDVVTLSTTGPSKAISLGDGDDTLILAADTVSTTGNLSGGAGTDTLSMASGNAATVSVSDVFEAKIDGFDKLSVGVVATTVKDMIDLSNLDDISYVISAGATAGVGTELELNKMAAGGTLELTGAGVLVDVNLADATGTADTFNIVTKLSTASVAYGIVDVAGVETVNLSVNDTSTAAGVQTASLTLADAALKSVVVTGNAHLNLTLDANVVALSSLDGSAMTGKLTATTNGTVAQTIKGGSAADMLTAAGNADVLIGGAGNDTLIVTGNLATLTGGAGKDTFNVADATTNVNSYATITDLAAGDLIKFAASGATFNASKVTLADTAVFQDYANAAIALTNAGDISWFQFGGSTYVVQNIFDGATFTNNTDVIVKITGTVDLSTASYSSTADLLLIGGPGA